MLAHMMATLLDDKVRKTFGARLKSLRKERGQTQKETAALLGVQHTHYNKYEAGLYVPPTDKAVQLAGIFGVTLDFLLLGNEPGNLPVRNTNLLERFRELDAAPRDIQETIVQLIDAVIFKLRVQGAATPKPL
jgi:transcriptional regulator with XRE-family HTH domain